MVKKSGLGVKTRGADLMGASGWTSHQLHLVRHFNPGPGSYRRDDRTTPSPSPLEWRHKLPQSPRLARGVLHVGDTL